MAEEKRVLLGMSGGTDSSVAVLLLRDAGYEVVGVTFRFWEEEGDGYLAEVRDLAHRMGIEHRVVDAREEFRQTVVRYFVDEYMAGRTPVPCVVCNNRMKWRLLAGKADEWGIEKIATGHYARTEEEAGVRYVCKGVDEMKDQSLFLWGMPQEVLARVLFPLGGFDKARIREMAAERGYPSLSTRPDSMGVCFCPGDYRLFLKRQFPSASEAIHPGDFVDEKGSFMARHKGYPFYTVGQRRGLGINANRPLYVKAVLPETNRVVLSGAEGLQRVEMELRDWRVACLADLAEQVVVRYRYDRQYVSAKVDVLSNGNLVVRFAAPVMGVAPGQSACFYRGDRLVGGGFIV